MIINRGEAKVNNHIPKADIFYCRPLRNVIFILLYRTFENKSYAHPLLCVWFFFFFFFFTIAPGK